MRHVTKSNAWTLDLDLNKGTGKKKSETIKEMFGNIKEFLLIIWRVVVLQFSYVLKKNITI